MSPVSVGTSSQSKYALKSGAAKLWIVLVGVNQYIDNSLPGLQYPALDCQGLSEALADATQAFPQKEIIVHHDFAAELPTLEIVRHSLTHTLSAANLQDTVLFYFSGHGLLDASSQQAILCLKNTEKQDPLNTGLSLQELLQLLDNCSARQQLVWLDTCHSGSMMFSGVNRKTEPGKNNYASLLNPASQLVEVLQKRAAESQGFYAILSCDRNQQSWEFPELGHGVFTYYLMRGLRGEAADSQGAIDADGLYKYLYHQTLQYIDKTNQQLRLINQQKRHRGETQLLAEYPLQTPKRIVEGIGELILGFKPDRIGFQPLRLALVVEGLSRSEKSLALSKVLRGAGDFELEYWPRPGKAVSEVQTAIQLYLRSHLPVESDPDKATALLYLRGRLEQTEAGEAYLVLPDEVKISRSWLRQELRRSKTAQQIIILDCPGANLLSEWVEDLKLGFDQGQCLIAAAATLEAPERFTQALLETLLEADKQIGLPVAGWISRLQMNLAGTGIALHVWLSGAKGVIEVLPGKIGGRIVATKDGLDFGLCPYMGLQAFGEEDYQFFYGRETLIQQLINQLNHRAFLAVVGASGSGKSSVVHAGLIAQLRLGKQIPGSEQWWIKSLRPTANPLSALAWRLVDAGTETERSYQQMELEAMLYEGVEGFVRWLRSRPEPMVVLIVDQFEELFTLATAEDRKCFLAILLGALDYAADRFKLAIAIRADFISSCLELPALATYLQDSNVLVPPYLTKDDYCQAILMPAEKVGLEVEPELVEVLLQELNRSAGELPLLQFVLEQLWEQRQAGELTLEVYQHKIGGIKGALERKAQAVYESLDVAEKACAEWIFLNLTQLGEGKEDTRRRVFKSELLVKKYPAALIERTLQALTAAKLIVINLESHEEVTGSSKEARETPLGTEEITLLKMKEEVTVEVAHEVLIRHWSTLRWWLEENRARLRVQWQLVQAAMLWKQSGKQSEFLLHGVRLAEAEDIYIKYTDELSEDVQLFVEACSESRKQQQLQLKRRLRQAQVAVVTISVLALGAFGLGGLAYLQSLTAQLREIEALNSLSETYLLSNKQLEAMLTSVRAARQLKQMTRLGNLLSFRVPLDIQTKTASALQQTIDKIEELNRLEQHNDEVFSVYFSPDGQTLASASADQTVILWRRDGQLLRVLKGHNDGIWGVRFSPDGKLVASASEDATIKLWRTSDGELLGTLKGHNAGVNSVSFSSDGLVIASASKDQTIKLWRVSDRQLLKTLKGHSDMIASVSFSPDGKLIASSSADKTIKIWNASNGQLLRTLTGHNAGVWGINFSPDGELIASGSADQTIKIWRTRDGYLLQNFAGHNDEVSNISFNSDGQIIASASRDNTIKIWSTKNGSLLHTIQGHSAGVEDVNFSRDGLTIASASRDTTIKLWKISNQTLPSVIQGHSAGINSISFSPEGHLLASASADKTIKLWQVSNGSLVRTLSEHTTEVKYISFSPDGQILASANKDNTVKLWQVRDGALIKTLPAHTLEVTSVSFSPDGQIVASASRDRTVKLWNASNGSLIKIIKGHNAEVERVVFSPDGQIVASASRDNTIKLWSQRDRKLITTINPQSGQVYSVSFTLDGQRIASANEDGTVKIWRPDGTLLQTLQGHLGYIWDVSFSPDGQMIASAGEDKTVKLWRTSDGKLLRTFDGHKAAVASVKFSPDGKAIASASWDKTIRFWHLEGTELQTLDSNSLHVRACNWLHDYLKTNPKLSQQERQLCSD